MTLMVGMRLRGGAVLASDSQVTRGGIRQEEPKLFRSGSLIWGSAGDYAATQELHMELESVDIERTEPRHLKEQLQAAVRTAVRAAAADADETDRESLHALFAWHARGRSWLLRVGAGFHAEFAREYTAIGSGNTLANFALFGFSRAEFLDYESLPLETAKALAFLVTDDVIRATPVGVSGPVQLAVVAAESAIVLSAEERRAVEDTVGAFKESQRDFLGRFKTGIRERGTGLRPR